MNTDNLFSKEEKESIVKAAESFYPIHESTSEQDREYLMNQRRQFEKGVHWLKSQEPKRKYVWLNLPDGEFSNSWSKDIFAEHLFSDKELIEGAKKRGLKLIEYRCVNEKDFEFYNKMKLR